MNFCVKCDNMYYLRLSKDNPDKLVYYCRKCGNVDDNVLQNDGIICVSKTHLKKTKQTYNNIINEYTKLDPTLPRINNMKCPNVECSSNQGESKSGNDKNEIIFLRYDNDNMKYIYLCNNCNFSWKNN